MELNDFFDHATEMAAHVIAVITPDQLSRQSPCTDWDGKALLEHMFGVNGQAKAMAAGVDVAVEGSTPDPIGSDLLASYAASVAGVRLAFSNPDTLTRILATPMGPFDGRVVFTVTSLEQLIHGWDLAVTVGAPVELDPVVVGYAFRAIEDMPQVLANFRAWGALGPPRTAPEGASAGGRLLAMLGRAESVPSHSSH